MLTVTPFNGNLKVHIRQFYVNGNGEMKAGRIRITLSVQEFNEFVKLIPQVQGYRKKDLILIMTPEKQDKPLELSKH